jgi:hypothetical protein
MSGSRRAAPAARCPIAARRRSPPALAERHCRDLTHAVIAELPALGFELTREDVLAWLEAEPAAA